MKRPSQALQIPHEVKIQERRNERKTESRKLSVLKQRLQAAIRQQQQLLARAS